MDCRLLSWILYGEVKANLTGYVEILNLHNSCDSILEMQLDKKQHWNGTLQHMFYPRSCSDCLGPQQAKQNMEQPLNFHQWIIWSLYSKNTPALFHWYAQFHLWTNHQLFVPGNLVNLHSTYLGTGNKFFWNKGSTMSMRCETNVTQQLKGAFGCFRAIKRTSF